MKAVASLHTLALSTITGLAACASSPPTAPSPQAPVAGSEATERGVTAEQTVADDQVVERVANAHCDRSQSCNRIGPGATYRDRADCVSRVGAAVSKDLNASRCPGGIGERALAQCVKSLHEGECDAPGEEYGNISHCKLDSLCIN
jgi:hypothetical protein